MSETNVFYSKILLLNYIKKSLMESLGLHSQQLACIGSLKMQSLSLFLMSKQGSLRFQCGFHHVHSMAGIRSGSGCLPRYYWLRFSTNLANAEDHLCLLFSQGSRLRGFLQSPKSKWF